MKKIFVISLVLFWGVSAKTQTIYEHAIIKYSVAVSQISQTYTLTESYEGNYLTKEGKLDEGFTNSNFKPLLQRINSLSKAGWEVQNNHLLKEDSLIHYIYYIRRKI